ncbi:hypothetical protein ABGB17_11065 [Sphaerisporangium sp. B11E5]|uniref:hypothetical protein n=1 Tax=Sphaerisporangium sp. B11E5 TaxID=3153563 RepID=UPI00325EA564
MRTALALFEVRRLLRSPLLWAAAALAVTWRATMTWQMMPNWSLEAVHTATATLIVGAAALVAANLVTTRDRRDGIREALAALPVRAPARTSAAVVATCAVAVLGATAATLLLLATLSVDAVPAGRLDVYELCGGVAAVALAAALGVALGRWIPHPMAPLVAIFLLGMAMIVGAGGRLLPVVFVWDMPVHLSRPSGLHVVYVCALVVLAGAAALLRYGPRPARVTAAVTALAVAAGVTTATAGEAQDVPAATQHCERRGDLTYCAFPGYEPWIALWAGAVEPVARALPPAARAHLPQIRQRAGGDMEFYLPQADADRSVRPGQTWGRNGGETAYRRTLAARTAAAITGLPWGGRNSQVDSLSCDARDQARTVVALWLAGHTAAQRLPVDVEIIRKFGNRRVGTMGRSDMGWVDYSAAELEYSRHLLARPGARQAVWEHWDRLLDPRTTVRQALPLLGLRPLPATYSALPADRMREEACP